MAETASQLNGRVPPKRLPKDELARTHKSHLRKQDLNPNAPRPVKQPLLEQAYPASTKSIRDLEIVNHTPPPTPKPNPSLTLTLDPPNLPPCRNPPPQPRPHSPGHLPTLPRRRRSIPGRRLVRKRGQTSHLQPQRLLHPIRRTRGLRGGGQGAVLQVQRLRG